MALQAEVARQGESSRSHSSWLERARSLAREANCGRYLCAGLLTCAAIWILGAGCATLGRSAGGGSGAEELASIQIGFGWFGGSPEKERLAADFHATLAAAVARGGSLDVEAVVAAFRDAVRTSLTAGRVAGVLGSGSIDWYEGAFDWGDGNRLHVSFELDDLRGFPGLLLRITRPAGHSLRAWVFGADAGNALFETRDLPVESFHGASLDVNDMFDHFQGLTTARLRFQGAGGHAMGVYRCFPAREPGWTAFSFQTPQDLDAQSTALDDLVKRFDVHDHWIFSSPDRDLAGLYQQVSIVRAGQGPFERVARVLEILREGGEEEFLTAIATARFPDGPVLRVERQELAAPIVRVELGEDPVRLMYLQHGTLDVAYDSGSVPRRAVERADQGESFNFGSWLPDLWRGANEELFIAVFRMNRARAIASGETLADKALFDRTVHDLTRIGVYFDPQPVRIAGVEYQIQITEHDVASLWAELGKAGAAGPAVPRGAVVQPPTAGLSWNLECYQAAGMTFYRDAQFVYYEVQADDARGGGLDGIRRKLRAAFPGRYEYPLAFNGFRDDHLAPGLLLVVPEPPAARFIDSNRLRTMVDAACRAEGFGYPELVFALVWNESRAGLDNFFRFEESRLDAVSRLRERQSGADREAFDRVYGRFGALLAGSYGPGHVLYETAWALGFRGSPGELAFPERNLALMARYLRGAGIDRSTSIETVSRVYNGPGYAQNGYHLRLRQNLANAERVYETRAGG